MFERIISIARIVLIVFALISIAFHVRIILELALNIKYGVVWFSPESLESFLIYLTIHFVFILLLVVYLICECVIYGRKHKKN